MLYNTYSAALFTLCYTLLTLCCTVHTPHLSVHCAIQYILHNAPFWFTFINAHYCKFYTSHYTLHKYLVYILHKYLVSPFDSADCIYCQIGSFSITKPDSTGPYSICLSLIICIAPIIWISSCTTAAPRLYKHWAGILKTLYSHYLYHWRIFLPFLSFVVYFSFSNLATITWLLF